MGFDKVTKEEARKFAMEEFEADLKMGDVSTSEAEILDYFFTYNASKRSFASQPNNRFALSGRYLSCGNCAQMKKFS